MNFKGFRVLHASLAILFVLTLMMAGMVQPAAAQSPATQSTAASHYEDVVVMMQDGWKARGRHAVADDFVVTCPVQEVLDPSHPCSDANVQPKSFDDYALVCPNLEVIDPSHPCASRRAQIVKARPADFVLVCPVKEVLDPTHPCAETNLNSVQFKMPSDYVMTCPTREVLDPGHPCAERNRSSSLR